MARTDRRHPANAPGSWFVDQRCIDCGTCREQAPTLFGYAGAQSVVVRQPCGPHDELAAWRAAKACPPSSIGRSPHTPAPEGTYPWLIDSWAGASVFDLGHTAESSFGATSYLVERSDGNLMVDAPRFVRPVRDTLDSLGGLAHVLLTHRDDVADARQWAQRYGSRSWMHERDRSAAPWTTDVLTGDDPVEVAPGVVAVPVPGHTAGSVAYSVDGRWLFTGDSLAWSHDERDLVAFRDACWYSWQAQSDSLGRLADQVPVQWVLPGHGARIRLEPGDGRSRLAALSRRMVPAPG